MSLSGRAHEDPLDRGVGGETDRGGGDGVVGLELDHRPEHDAERLDGGLGDGELRQQLGRHAGRRLVAGEEVVAERLDDPVRGAADVRGALLAEQVQELVAQPRHAREVDAVPPEDRRPRREVRPEELVGGVDEVDLHRGVRSRRSRRGRAGGRGRPGRWPAGSAAARGSRHAGGAAGSRARPSGRWWPCLGPGSSVIDAAAGERALVADREPGRRLELGDDDRVRDGDAQDPDRAPRPASRPRRAAASAAGPTSARASSAAGPRCRRRPPRRARSGRR